MIWIFLATTGYLVFIGFWMIIWIVDARREEEVAHDPERTREAREHPERTIH